MTNAEGGNLRRVYTVCTGNSTNILQNRFLAFLSEVNFVLRQKLHTIKNPKP
jgi:hypothetical protein